MSSSNQLSRSVMGEERARTSSAKSGREDFSAFLVNTAILATSVATYVIDNVYGSQGFMVNNHLSPVS